MQNFIMFFGKLLLYDFLQLAESLQNVDFMGAIILFIG